VIAEDDFEDFGSFEPRCHAEPSNAHSGHATTDFLRFAVPAAMIFG
jgi:hypothetical protein